MKDSREYERRLKRELERLVRILGVDSGNVRMKVHQGTIRTVVIDHSVKIPIRTDATCEEHPGDEDVTKEFVIDKLEPCVRDMIGQYGSVVAEVTSGNVAEFRLESKYRGDGRDKQQP